MDSLFSFFPEKRGVRSGQGWFIAVLILGFSLLAITTALYFRMLNYIKAQEYRYAYFWSLALASLENPEMLNELQFSIIRSNKNIPVVALDNGGNIIAVRNLDSLTLNEEDRLSQWIGVHSQAGRIIHVTLPDGEHLRIVYGNSRLLSVLRWYPYLQIALLIVILVLTVLAAIHIRRRRETETLFMLANEVSNQLRVPLSSLWAWVEIIRDSGFIPAPVIVELEKDLSRAQTVLNRFARFKEGGTVQMVSLPNLIRETINYIQERTSARVVLRMVNSAGNRDLQVVGEPLIIQWAIESALFQTLYRLNESGEIGIKIARENGWALVEIADRGPPLKKALSCSSIRNNIRFLETLVSKKVGGRVKIMEGKKMNRLCLYFPAHTIDQEPQRNGG